MIFSDFDVAQIVTFLERERRERRTNTRAGDVPFGQSTVEVLTIQIGWRVVGVVEKIVVDDLRRSLLLEGAERTFAEFARVRRLTLSKVTSTWK